MCIEVLAYFFQFVFTRAWRNSRKKYLDPRFSFVCWYSLLVSWLPFLCECLYSISVLKYFFLNKYHCVTLWMSFQSVVVNVKFCENSCEILFYCLYATQIFSLINVPSALKDEIKWSLFSLFSSCWIFSVCFCSSYSDCPLPLFPSSLCFCFISFPEIHSCFGVFFLLLFSLSLVMNPIPGTPPLPCVILNVVQPINLNYSFSWLNSFLPCCVFLSYL